MAIEKNYCIRDLTPTSDVFDLGACWIARINGEWGLMAMDGSRQASQQAYLREMTTRTALLHYQRAMQYAEGMLEISPDDILFDIPAKATGSRIEKIRQLMLTRKRKSQIEEKTVVVSDPLSMAEPFSMTAGIMGLHIEGTLADTGERVTIMVPGWL